MKTAHWRKLSIAAIAAMAPFVAEAATVSISGSLTSFQSALSRWVDGGNGTVNDSAIGIDSTPVSYTHLDVYKRQHQVALFDFGRLAGARAAALDVNHDQRDFRHDGQTDGFLLERITRSGGDGDGAFAGIRRTDGEGAGGDFILGLVYNAADFLEMCIRDSCLGGTQDAGLSCFLVTGNVAVLVQDADRNDVFAGGNFARPVHVQWVVLELVPVRFGQSGAQVQCVLMVQQLDPVRVLSLIPI